MYGCECECSVEIYKDNSTLTSFEHIANVKSNTNIAVNRGNIPSVMQDTNNDDINSEFDGFFLF